MLVNLNASFATLAEAAEKYESLKAKAQDLQLIAIVSHDGQEHVTLSWKTDQDI